MMTRIKPYLQLIRLPNLFTAAADSLAGWLIVGGSLAELGRWLPLVLASVAIYAGGIVLNDVFDFEIDLRERPGRPLPSGRISRKLAACGGGLALVAGPVLAGLTGSSASFIVALLLASCVLAYDAGLKRTVMGPQAMGACRALNLLLGLSPGIELGGPYAWLAAGSLGLFVAGVTWISRSEVETGKTRGMIAGLILQDLALLGLVGSGLNIGTTEARVGQGPGLWMVGIATLGVVALVVNHAGLSAIRMPRPDHIQKAVKTGVFSLVWLDVALVASAVGPGPALAVALLWVPAFWLGRWLYAT